MVLGAALAAIGAYVFQFVGTRVLGEVRYAPIGTLWTIQYLLVSVALLPLETYVARRTLLAHGDVRSASVSFARLWAWLVVLGVISTVVCWVLRARLFHGLNDFALVVGLVVFAYGAFLIVRGRLAGTERFKAYGLVTASESIGRAALGLAVVFLAPTPRAFGWIMPLGAAAAAGWLMSLRRQTREPRFPPIGSADPPRTARFLALTTAATAIMQVLIAAGPLVAAFLHAGPAEISIVFVTLTAVRLPMVFAFGGVLSRLLPTFMHLDTDKREPWRLAVRIAAGAVGVALAVGAVAALIGSRVIGLLFGSSFAPSWWLASGATISVLLATGSIVLYQLLIARGAEGVALIAWVAALVVSAVVLAISRSSPTGRIVLSLLAGQIVAMAGLVVTAYALQPSRWTRAST